MATLDGWSISFWNGMLLHLWQSTLFLLVVALAALLLRNAPGRVIGSLYSIGLLKLFLPLPWLGEAARTFVAWSGGASAAAVPPTATGWPAIQVVMYPALLESGTAGLVPGTGLALTAVWAVGASWCLLRESRIGFPGPVERPLAGAPGPTCDLLLSALVGTGLARDRVRVSPGGATPFVRGLLSPVVVVPTYVVTRLDQDELRSVLMHEAEHIRHRDPLRLALLHAARAAFFFYPPAWWLVGRIRESFEMACDEAVVRGGQSPATYCRSLARTLKLGLDHTPAATPAGILGHRSSLLLRRLERIRSGRRFEAMPYHRLTLVLVAITALALSVLPVGPTSSAGGQHADALDRLAEADLEVVLRFERVPLRTIFEALQAASRTEFSLAGDLGSELADLDPGRVPLSEALEQLASAADLDYLVLGPRTVQVRKRSGDDLVPPRMISRVEPVYPKEARAQRRGGRVILQLLVDPSGLVQDVTPLRIEPEDGEMFVTSAVEAVRQWRYEPARQNGEVVEFYLTVVVEFSIQTEPTAKPDDLTTPI
jgi:TonB family protein